MYGRYARVAVVDQKITVKATQVNLQTLVQTGGGRGDVVAILANMVGDKPVDRKKDGQPMARFVIEIANPDIGDKTLRVSFFGMAKAKIEKLVSNGMEEGSPILLPCLRVEQFGTGFYGTLPDCHEVSVQHEEGKLRAWWASKEKESLTSLASSR